MELFSLQESAHGMDYYYVQSNMEINTPWRSSVITDWQTELFNVHINLLKGRRQLFSLDLVAKWPDPTDLSETTTAMQLCIAITALFIAHRCWCLGWFVLTAISAHLGYIVPCPPRKLILQHTYSRQMTESGFEPRSFHCTSKYCNHSATEAANTA